MTNGIDVSYAQGKIDWEKVKAAGIEYAFLRIGYGREASQKDAQLEANYAGTRAVGIPVGGYHYSYAADIAGAEKEARACLAMIGDKSFQLPVAYDMEESKQFILPPETLYRMYKAFAGIIEAAGHRCMLYTNKNWLMNKWDSTALAADGVKVWMAQYNRTMTYSGKSEIVIWQNSSNGSVDGIQGRVDTNITLGNISALMAARTGWKKDSADRWRYETAEGFVRDAWQQVDGLWYHFDPEGTMQTGWLEDEGKWYYLKENGAMASDELLHIRSEEHGEELYAFAADGHMLQTGSWGNLI